MPGDQYEAPAPSIAYQAMARVARRIALPPAGRRRAIRNRHDGVVHHLAGDRRADALVPRRAGGTNAISSGTTSASDGHLRPLLDSRPGAATGGDVSSLALARDGARRRFGDVAGADHLAFPEDGQPVAGAPADAYPRAGNLRRRAFRRCLGGGGICHAHASALRGRPRAGGRRLRQHAARRRAGGHHQPGEHHALAHLLPARGRQLLRLGRLCG